MRTRCMRTEDIQVAVMYPGGRSDRLTVPLCASNMDVSIEPSDPYEHDIVMLDNADKWIWVPVVQSRNTDAKVIYRIRGDMLRAYIEMNRTKLKYHMAKRMIGRVDGAVSIEPILGRQFENATGVSPVGYASLAKRLDNWPNVNHTNRSLRAISLTNANYFDKIQPIVDYAGVIDDYFSENPGYWRIYGKGQYSDYLHEHIAGFDNVEYCGYTENVAEELGMSNIMFHFSRFDSLPNAILEGMASNLPVITNPYPVFQEYGYPLIIRNRTNIRAMLNRMHNPSFRERYGGAGMNMVEYKHSPGRVGYQYAEFFKKIL